MGGKGMHKEKKNDREREIWQIDRWKDGGRERERERARDRV